MGVYTVSVELVAYDLISVEAESHEEARIKAIDVLRREQRYQQTTFRPMLGSVHYVRNEDSSRIMMAQRGQDPLMELLVDSEAPAGGGEE
jgi:hypothetical protein